MMKEPMSNAGKAPGVLKTRPVGNLDLMTRTPRIKGIHVLDSLSSPMLHTSKSPLLWGPADATHIPS